ncbi:hypothetical protein FHX80_13179 [Streptomyces brevispora]|uniref:Uncharacterized protein n=1 Tax=Streptomyces brevispora TaxID=887462 RepID=A0A561TUH5_9ACTN|nr:hypothetical protein FHX80_13179 [Streptomyces brevispora]
MCVAVSWLSQTSSPAMRPSQSRRFARPKQHPGAITTSAAMSWGEDAARCYDGIDAQQVLDTPHDALGIRGRVVGVGMPATRQDRHRRADFKR